MYWPIMTDYQEAIQSPQTCFSDNDLREGRFDLDNLGLPRPISGNFACVYGLTYKASKWAVRCFLKNTQDQEKRYQYIHSYLEKFHSPYFVPFKYIRNGIRVKGVWYPILKMEWINGLSLSAYIEKNLTNQAAIQSLSQKFIGLAKNLEENSIAHGDLQHGNIIVVGEEIKLVDYDGMYVPDLDGMPSIEVGHPNYQHPMRSEKDFGPHLDRFSEWVIYLSLVAISRDPSLWTNLKGGDENLIFRNIDFSNPDASDSIRILENQPDPEIKKIAWFLREIIDCKNLPQVPKLDSNSISLFDPKPVPASSGERTGIKAKIPTWILDYIDVNEFEFYEDLHVERRSLAVFLLAELVTLAFFVLQEMNSAIFLLFIISEPLFMISFIYFRFSKNAKVIEKQRLLSQKKNHRQNLTQLTKKIEEVKTNISQIMIEEKEVTVALNQRANRVAQIEQDEIANIDEEVNAQLQTLDKDVLRLDSEEAEDYRNKLTSYQEEFIVKKLSSVQVADASIHGIGAENIRRLSKAGIETAGDIEDYQVRQDPLRHDREIAILRIKGKGGIRVASIGPAKAKLLVEWRKNLEQQMNGKVPKAVSPEISAQIKTKYELKRENIANQKLYVIPDEANQRKTNVHTRYRKALEQNRKEVKRLSRYYLEKKVKLEKVLADLEAEKIKVNLEQTALLKKLLPYKKINLYYYVRRVLQI